MVIINVWSVIDFVGYACEILITYKLFVWLIKLGWTCFKAPFQGKTAMEIEAQKNHNALRLPCPLWR